PVEVAGVRRLLVDDGPRFPGTADGRVDVHRVRRVRAGQQRLVRGEQQPVLGHVEGDDGFLRTVPGLELPSRRRTFGRRHGGAGRPGDARGLFGGGAGDRGTVPHAGCRCDEDPLSGGVGGGQVAVLVGGDVQAVRV